VAVMRLEVWRNSGDMQEIEAARWFSGRLFTQKAWVDVFGVRFAFDSPVTPSSFRRMFTAIT
jgi:hypothetical protein